MQPQFFSIIIPTRTITLGIIEETLPALAKQTHKQFEVILLPDKLEKLEEVLLKEYAFLSIIPTHVKTRPGDKRDIGARQAKGEIIAFLDDDALPVEDWLEQALTIFDTRPDVAAVGGPGMLPLNASLWERMFDAVLRSSFGSGGYSYRFTPEPERYVDDFPSMNLMIRKQIFDKLGGFQNQYWPGEDSKLLNKLITQEKKLVLYHPDVAVYHHRRVSLAGHIKQHASYGFHRGSFFAHGDENSKNIRYLIPSFFALYLVIVATVLAIPTIFTMPYAVIILTIPLMMYGLILYFEGVYQLICTRSLAITGGTLFLIPLTHLTYGVSFIKGYANEMLKGIFTSKLKILNQ